MNGVRAHCGMTGKTTPLYLVCSPCRCVGTTLVSRLLTEFYVVHDQPVAAFDLADEGPQLADYLPEFATIANIGDIRGQMALFDRLIAERATPTVIDVSHRAFRNFFTVVQETGFFPEARRHFIEPLILFIIDPNADSTKSYAILRRRFTKASFLPVRNQIEASTIAYRDASSNASMLPASLDIPLLGFSLRALIDRQSFSFSQFWRAIPVGLPELDDKLGKWVEHIFCQFRDLEFFLGCEDLSTHVAGERSRRPRRTYRQRQRDARPLGGDYGGYAGSAVMHQRSTNVPEQVIKCAPKRTRCVDSDPMDQSGNTIIAMLQKAADLSTTIAAAPGPWHELSRQLRDTEDQINQLEREIEHFRDRAVRAETWLQLIQREIKEKLIAPMAAARLKSTT
jgi:hypothetical protein